MVSQSMEIKLMVKSSILIINLFNFFIHFQEVIFTFNSPTIFEFWDHITQRLVTLQIHHSFITETNLSKMLLSCSVLESLHLLECRDILITGNLFSNELMSNLNRKTMPNLKELYLENNSSYFSDALVDRLMSLVSCLEALSFAGTSVSFHPGINRRFYPKNQDKSSELVLTFEIIFSHITQHFATVQCLDFSRTTINDKAGVTLSQASIPLILPCEFSKH